MTQDEPPVTHQILDVEVPADQCVLDTLRADTAIEFTDTWPAQASALAKLRPAPGPEPVSYTHLTLPTTPYV